MLSRRRGASSDSQAVLGLWAILLYPRKGPYVQGKFDIWSGNNLDISPTNIVIALYGTVLWSLKRSLRPGESS